MNTKPEFPALEEIKWVKIEAPKCVWNMVVTYLDEIFVNGAFVLFEGSVKHEYRLLKELYENSSDFKVTWKLKEKDPHAGLKLKKEEAEALGYVVKVFEVSVEQCSEIQINTIQDVGNNLLSLKYYKLDWNKVLAWSYANDEFVKCEFSDSHPFYTDVKGELIGLKRNGFLLLQEKYKCVVHKSYCRLPEGTTPKDEWLTEVSESEVFDD